MSNVQCGANFVQMGSNEIKKTTLNLKWTTVLVTVEDGTFAGLGPSLITPVGATRLRNSMATVSPQCYSRIRHMIVISKEPFATHLMDIECVQSKLSHGGR